MFDRLAEHIRQMLVQRSTQGNIDKLHSPANRQRRHAAFDELLGQFDLHSIALGVDHVHRLVRRSTVQRRIDVSATGQECPHPIKIYR